MFTNSRRKIQFINKWKWFEWSSGMRIYEKGWWISVSHCQAMLYAGICAIWQLHVFCTKKEIYIYMPTNWDSGLTTQINSDKFLVFQSWSELSLMVSHKALLGCQWSSDFSVFLPAKFSEEYNLTSFMTCYLKDLWNLPNWPQFEICLINIKYFHFLKRKKKFLIKKNINYSPSTKNRSRLSPFLIIAYNFYAAKKTKIERTKFISIMGFFSLHIQGRYSWKCTI